MNVYQMIESGAFDAPGGLWVKRDSWGNTVALVTEFDEFKGQSPYFNNPVIRVDLFYDRGALGVRYKKSELLSCPGTRAYTHISSPSWWVDGNYSDQYGANHD